MPVGAAHLKLHWLSFVCVKGEDTAFQMGSLQCFAGMTSLLPCMCWKCLLEVFCLSLRSQNDCSRILEVTLQSMLDNVSLSKRVLVFLFCQPVGPCGTAGSLSQSFLAGSKRHFPQTAVTLVSVSEQHPGGQWQVLSHIKSCSSMPVSGL